MSAEIITADPLLVDTVDRLLADTAVFDVVEQAEPDRWCPAVWDPLAEAGFPWVSLPEEAGGSGGTLADALAVVRSVGAHAAPVPVAETALLGGWLLTQAGLDMPAGPISVVGNSADVTVVDGRIKGSAVVAWAQASAAIALLIADGEGWTVASVRPDQVSIDPGANLAGEPRDTVTFDLPVDAVVTAPAPAGVDPDALRRRGALSRVVLSAGAAATLLQVTIDYTNERHQFGKRIASFQAVQAHLVHTAQSSVRLSMAADMAAISLGGGDAAFPIAAAKIVADDAAIVATRAAHQAHGAMGVTREYRLHHLSRRLWSWRFEYGTGLQWSREIGTELVAAGGDAFFPTITG